MRDRDVRQQLFHDLREWHDEPGTLFVDELDLGGLVRVDLAAVNGALWGYEIKSERDTLRRLPTQVQVYSQVLDYAVLVVAERHYEHAVGLLPDWWEVIVVTGEADDVVLDPVRPGAKNTGVDAMRVAQLLWRDEALAELTERGLDRGVRSKPRQAVWQRLVDVLELTDLQQVVRTRLKARQGWRGSR
ncbi:MAG: sce7726 family protein [Dehalococcoidia bacterium]